MSSDGRKKDREEETHAVVILIDNSVSSINEDFHRNRLEAQKTTAERYAQYLFSSDTAHSQVAIGTMSNAEFGIRMSFTNSPRLISDTLNSITSCGTELLLLRGIKCAILALRHFQSTRRVSQKRIIVFVGCQNDADLAEAHKVETAMANENIVLDIFVIGKDVPNVKTLNALASPRASKGKTRRGVFMEIPSSKTVLSDDVLMSVIGSGPTLPAFPSRRPRAPIVRTEAPPRRTRRHAPKGDDGIRRKDDTMITERSK